MLIAACIAAGCGGATGTLELALVSAPGSQLLDGVETLRMTLTNPRRVVEATRSAGGFALALEIDAEDATSTVIVEGFDAGGALIACGRSPVFPIAAINAGIAVYMAAPRSIALSPAALAAPRSEVAGATLDHRALLAGGRDAAGAPTSAIAVYNSYDHTLTPGLAMPAARTQLAVGAANGGGAYLFGGLGSDGNPTGTLWRFDTSVPPAGAYGQPSEHPDAARAGQLLVPIGFERYLATGSPVIAIDRGTVAVRSEIAALPAAGAAVVEGGAITAIFAGEPLVRFRAEAFDTLAAGRSNATAAALPDGRVAVVGGGDPGSRDALIVDAQTGNVTVVPGALSTPRVRPSVAATARYLVVAGGGDAGGAPIASADILDAATLAPVATLAILARTGTLALSLPTDQVLLVGGTPASSQLELFTPEP